MVQTSFSVNILEPYQVPLSKQVSCAALERPKGSPGTATRPVQGLSCQHKNTLILQLCFS